MPFKTHKDNECVDQIARNFVSNIIDGTESTVKKKLEDAEYDKTFSCNILGINQVFSDEVKKSTQEYLIKAHNIPEISEGEEYYTVKIEGHFYCIKQASVYGMEQNVTVKVPNGDWNKMYISTAGKVKGLDISGTVLGQVKFTAGRAYYNGEEYVLQRGNNRRIIAVSKGDKCSIIDTPFDASELDAETAATTAILKGLDSKATIEATYDIEKDEWASLAANVNSIEDATVDWGDGTIEPITDNGMSHKYAISGTVTQKITAPNATNASPNAVYTGKTDRGIVYFIGGNIERVTRAIGYAKMVIWGNKVQRISTDGWGSSIKYKCDISFPPFATEFYGSWGNNVNYCYIPAVCTTLSNMQSDAFENIEIESSGEDLIISGDYLFGHSGNYIGRAMNSISLPARIKISDKSYQWLASYRALKHMRFESGHTVIPESFATTANKNYVTNVYSKMYVYIPKTVTKIEYSAFSSPVHFVYEGTYTQWNNIDKNDSFVVNGGTYELSCSGAPKDGGLRYDNFESDVKNAGTRVNINAGNGIEVDNSSNTISISLDDNTATSEALYVNAGLGIRSADNDIFGAVKRGSLDLSCNFGLLKFLGAVSGFFNNSNVTDTEYSVKVKKDFGIKENDLLVALWSRWQLGSTYSGITAYPFFKVTWNASTWTLKGNGNTIDCPIEKMSISTDEGITKVNFVMIPKSELSYTGDGYSVNWFIIKRIWDGTYY